MNSRRFLIPLGLVLVAAACSDSTAPRQVTWNPPFPASGSAPHFLRAPWAGEAQPLFSAVGAATATMVSADPLGLFASGPAPASVQMDNATSTMARDVQSLSWTHAVGTGANRLLVVGVSIRNAGNVVRQVTYGGVPLAFLGARNNSDNTVRAELWYLNAPASGTATVSVTLSAKAKMVVGALSFAGVDPVAPLRGFTSVGGTSNSTNPMVADSSGANEVGIAVMATTGAAGTLTPLAGVTEQWDLRTNTADGEIAGSGGVAAGASALVMGWTKTANARWAIAAAAVKPYVSTSLGLTTYQATFWAVRGQTRSLQINYVAGGGTQPFMLLTTTDPAYAPGKGNLAVGDSVLVTATVDRNNILVNLEPTGVLFGTPAVLKIWYGGAGGDLNGDGVVDGTDTMIAQQLLGMWYQEGSTSPWTPIPATKNLTEQSLTANLGHFSGYGVSW